MRDIGRDRSRTLIEQRLRRVAQGPARIDDVVDQDAVPARHVADDIHHLAFAGAIAPLVDDRQRCVVEPLGQCTRTHDAADIGADDHQVLVAVARLDICRHHRGGEEIVGRDVEEALDLSRVEIDREHALGPCLGNQIGYQLGRNRSPRAGFAVLAGIAEIGHDCCNASRRSALERVDADQQFHQIVVGRIAGRLDDEHVFAAHVLVDLDEDLLVGKAAHLRIHQRHFEITCNGPCKRQVRVGGHDFHAENPRANWMCAPPSRASRICNNRRARFPAPTTPSPRDVRP